MEKVKGKKEEVRGLTVRTVPVDTAANEMVFAVLGDKGAEIYKEARKAVQLPGCLRRLRKQLWITNTLTASKEWTRSLSDAFAFAGTLLVD